MQKFGEIRGNFGFGCMRLPMAKCDHENNIYEVDYAEFSKMIEAFFAAGFNYFDTAHGYLEGASEMAIRECLAAKYPRDSYVLTDKLSKEFFSKEEDIRALFYSQLEACGVEYFDFYLMHAQGRKNYKAFKKCRAYETACELKAEGRIRHIGISFHDTADVLEMILSEHPEIEIVQIQLNYVDYEDAAVQSKKLLEVCKKYDKPVIVMEPVKGGSLIRLPEEAQAVFNAVEPRINNAAYAIRFAAGCDPVIMTLSGMSNLEQMQDNLSFMRDFVPLNQTELEAVRRVCDIFKKQDIIPCTGCSYCTAGCPRHIAIPNLFSCMNAKKVFGDWNQDYYYRVVYTSKGRRASDCLKCGKCEQACPQNLEIRKLLEDVAVTFEEDLTRHQR